MRAPDRRRLGGVVWTAAALLVLTGVGAAIPGTMSAFTGTVTNSANTAVARTRFTCADVFAEPARQESAFFEYTLRDEKPTVASDSGPARNTGTYVGSREQDVDSPQACPADPGASYRLDGRSSLVTTSQQEKPIRQDFSIEVWFRTTAVSEKLIGFEDQQDGASSHYDKHLYLDSSGVLRYGVYDGGTETLTSPARLNDGGWHQAVATTSSSDGSVLYVDGDRVDANPKKVLAEDYPGFWRIGQGRTDGWPDAPADSTFTGSLAFAAAYGTVLSADDVRLAWSIGRPGAADPTTKTRTTSTPTSGVATKADPAAGTRAAPVDTAQPDPAAAQAASVG